MFLTARRLCVSVFTSIPSILQIYLNDEPLLSYQPDTLDSQQQGGGTGAITQRSDK